MNEIVRRTTGRVDPAEAARLSRSKLVPELIANDGASAEYMMRFGAALGIDPMSSFQHIFVFEDKKTGRLKAGMSAHLMQALAVAAGHDVSLEGNAIKATAVLTRYTSREKIERFRVMREEERRQKRAHLEDVDHLYKMERAQIRERIEDLQLLASSASTGSDESVAMEKSIREEIESLRKQLAGLHDRYNFDELRNSVSTTNFDLSKMVRFESVWTMSRAAGIEGLTNKSTWKNYGPEMLKNRAKSTVVRDGAIDVILGVKNILTDMGLVLSEDEHDHLAMSSLTYTAEEQGAEVDENERPIEGEVIDVTKPKASRAQNRLAAQAEKLAQFEPERIAAWAMDLAKKEEPGVDQKIARLYAVQKAANEAGKGDEEVPSIEGTASLSSHLDSIVNSLR